MKFEDIDDIHQRAKVFGGWIVKTYEPVHHEENGFSGGGDGWDWRVAMVFIPDVNHEWQLTNTN